MPRHISRLHLVKHQSQLCLALCRKGRALSEQDLNQTVRAINASQVAADLADTAGGEEIRPSCRRDIAGVDANQTTRSILQACKCKRSQRGRRSTLPSRPLLWARAARLVMSARRLPTRQAPTCRPCPRIASHRRGRRRRRHRHRRLYRRRRRRRHRRPHRRRRRHCRRHPRSHLPRPFSRRYPPLSTGSVPASSSSASAGPPATRCSTRASRRSARRNEPRLLPRAPAPDHRCDMC